MGRELCCSHVTATELVAQLDAARLEPVEARERSLGGETFLWVTARRRQTARSTLIMKFEFRASFPKGPESVTIAFPSVITASAGELSAFIEALAALRQGMLPVVATEPAGTFQVAANAGVAVAGDAVHGGVVLAVRHPGHGWVYGQVSAENVPGLVQSLSQHACPAPPPPVKH